MSTSDDTQLVLSANEVHLLRQLSVQLLGLLEEGTDAVVERLFPRVIRSDAEEDRDARLLIHQDLMRERLARLGEVLGVLDVDPGQPVDLVDDQPLLLMGVLNDLRLSLAVQSGLHSPAADREELDDDGRQMAALMDWLAWWQERILRLVDPDALRFYDEESDLSA
ncbi:MAG: DUF2017 family protein [Nitriliruptorales bacterium]|nr:DUF2017 family protein [Nitriliruptorales bacterium]